MAMSGSTISNRCRRFVSSMFPLIPANRAAVGWALVLMAAVLMSGSGCSTLASLGLPGGPSANRMLKSAKEISEIPSQAILAPKELALKTTDLYEVAIGDTIFIEPVSFDATIRLPGDQQIKPDGTVSLGEFGLYRAVGKTIPQIRAEAQQIIETELRQRLENEFAEDQRRAALEDFPDRPALEDDDEEELDIELADLEVARKEKEARRREKVQRELREALEYRIDERIKANVISARLVNWESQKIYVLGEVNSPGSYNFIGNEMVLDAIIEAGGLTTKSNSHQIVVTRPTPCGSCRKIMSVCYDQIVQLGDASTNYQLRAGDRVFVPSLTFWEDVKQSFSCEDKKCPRCSADAVGCCLPQGCESGGCQTGGCGRPDCPALQETLGISEYDQISFPETVVQ